MTFKEESQLRKLRKQLKESSAKDHYPLERGPCDWQRYMQALGGIFDNADALQARALWIKNCWRTPERDYCGVTTERDVRQHEIVGEVLKPYDEALRSGRDHRLMWIECERNGQSLSVLHSALTGARYGFATGTEHKLAGAYSPGTGVLRLAQLKHGAQTLAKSEIFVKERWAEIIAQTAAYVLKDRRRRWGNTPEADLCASFVPLILRGPKTFGYLSAYAFETDCRYTKVAQEIDRFIAAEEGDAFSQATLVRKNGAWDGLDTLLHFENFQ